MSPGTPAPSSGSPKEMQLLYFTPEHRDQLMAFFIVEIILLIMNYILFLLFLYFGLKVRVHPNLKFIGVFLVLSYFPNLTARMFTLGFQADWLPVEGDPTQNFWIILCTFYRVFNFGLIATIILWVSIERELALFYIRDYEKNHRLWIPMVLVVTSAIWWLTATYLFVFDIVPGSLKAFGGLVVITSTFGLVLFVHTYRTTQLLLYRIHSRKSITSKHAYTLSLRFQLEEIIWCGNLMKKGLITLGVSNIFTFCAFVPAQSSLVAFYFGTHFCQVLDCIYNILVALNCPVIGIGVLYQNEYLQSLVKATFCGNSEGEEEETVPDEGQVYFVHLQRQWDDPLEERGQKLKELKKKEKCHFETVYNIKFCKICTQ